MSPSKPQSHPQIYEYLKKYQEDPTSRVFAPLAEAYRKAGLIDEAIEIAREGLQVHPRFIGGQVALARALFDKGSFADVVKELAQVVQDVPDNLVAQRLMAESYLMMGEIAGALSAYKMLLYFSPQDPEIMKMVQELEAQAYEQGALVLRRDPKRPPVPDFAEMSAQAAIDSDPEVQKARQKALWIAKIEKLQAILQRLERHRVHSSPSH